VRPGARYPVLVQVNVDRDPAKSGFQPGDMAAALGEILALPNLEVQGLMTVGWLTATADEARTTFRELQALSVRLRARLPNLGAELSMGMTDDFEAAVEEGATIVRVGRALFGERPHEHDVGEVDHTH
jgi:PLP dependent protein